MLARSNIVCITVYILINFICECAKAQICNKTHLLPVTETFTVKMNDRYQLSPYCNPRVRRCWGTRWKTQRITRTKYVNSTFEDCCEGYLKEFNIQLICNPICSKPCINGLCRSPEECECYPGYRLDLNNKYNCTPVCEQECGHGLCISPSFCKCDTGYRYDLITKKCEPVCKTCVNGTCVAPDTCKCLTGYRIAQKYHCKPYCSKGCPHGSCISPETCVCDKGWQMIETDVTKGKTCQPICTQSCINSTCVAPETCECLPGYTKVDNSTCKPHCPDGCSNGTCIVPNLCVCGEGWQLTKDNGSSQCQPVCSKSCVNSVCIAPDKCECLSGYINLKNDTVQDFKNVCEPICSNDCVHGSCVKPETCICDVGWSMHRTAENETCQPICTQSCINGFCVAPNTCECLPGYRKSDTHDKCLNGSCDILIHNVSYTCELDVAVANNMQGVEKWLSSHWVYLAATALLLTVMAMFLYIVLYLCRKSGTQYEYGDGTVPVPVQNIGLKRFKNK